MEKVEICAGGVTNRGDYAVAAEWSGSNAYNKMTAAWFRRVAVSFLS
jgi:hypothetical protein